LLQELDSPEWMTPALKQSFVVSYVVLAPMVGAFADSMPKGRVMLITNAIKVVGCLLMLATLHPLAAYAVVGFGAAAYSPAKYGILTELLPAKQLVAANGWIEGTTVASIVLGVLLGGTLISTKVSTMLLGFDLPMIDTGIQTPPEAAICVIAVIYVIAAIFNWFIPDTGVDHRVPSKNPFYLIREFSHCVTLLWRDKLGQISLATTTLFWGAGATLQFIVLAWADKALGFDLSQASSMQGVVAVGIAVARSSRRATFRCGSRSTCCRSASRWARGHHDDLRQFPAGGHRPHDHHRRLRGLLRGADERAPAAPRPRADGRGPFHRRAELQREHRHPDHGRPVRVPSLYRSVGEPRDRDLRRVHVRGDAARAVAAHAQPDEERLPAPHRRGRRR
jgi:hypothetical protein